MSLRPPPGEVLPSQSLYRVWGNVSSRGAQAAFDYGSALPSSVGAAGYSHALRLPRDVAFDVRAEVVAGAATYFGTTQIAAITPGVSSVQLVLTRVQLPSPFIT